MGKAANIARGSVRGGFNLFWGIAVSTIISALGLIFVSRLLGPSEYGVFAIAVTAPNLIILFRDWGIDSATIKYTSQFSSENKPESVQNILAASVIFELVLGLLLTVVCFLLSGFLAKDVFHRPTIVPLIELTSFIVVGDALITATHAAFIGCQKLELTSVTMVFQSTLRVLMLILIILGFGVYGAVIGTTVPYLVTGLLGTAMLYVLIYKKLQTQGHAKLEIIKNIRTMIRYGLPLSISAILANFLTQIYNVLIAIYCTNQLIGNYNVAINFAIIITFFATPISTVLFPAFSQLNYEKDNETLRNVFRLSVKYGALLVIPAAAGTIVLSQPAIFTLFGEKYISAPLFTALIAIGYLYSAFGSLSVLNLINSQGKTGVYLRLTLLNFALGLPVSLILIPRFGVTGLIITTITTTIPSLVLSLWWVKKHFKVDIDFVSSAKTLSAGGIAAIVTYAVTIEIAFPYWAKLILGVLILITTYVVIIPVVGAIDQSDLQTLKKILGGLWPLSIFSGLLFRVIERIFKVTRSIRNASDFTPATKKNE